MFTGINLSIFDSIDFKEDSVRETIVYPILYKLGYLPSGEQKVDRGKSLRNHFIRVGTKNTPF